MHIRINYNTINKGLTQFALFTKQEIILTQASNGPQKYNCCMNHWLFTLNTPQRRK